MQQPPAYQQQNYPQQPATTVVYPPQQAPGANVVISQQPVQTGYVVQNVAPQQEGCCSGLSERFNASGGRITGIMQLIIAVLCIVLSGASYAVANTGYYNGYGIWSALFFFLPAGILGTISFNKSTAVIVAYLVMCILATLESFGMIAYEGVFAGVYALVNTCSSTCNYYYSSYDGCYSYCHSYGSTGAIAIHSVLAILAFVEFVVSIVGAALCCGGLRCCCASPTTTTTTTTTTAATTYYPNQGGYVVQPAPAQPGQYPAAGGVVQYPPTENKV